MISPSTPLEFVSTAIYPAVERENQPMFAAQALRTAYPEPSGSHLRAKPDQSRRTIRV